MKVRLTGTAADQPTAEANFENVILDFILEIDVGQNPFGGLLAVSFPVRAADRAVIRAGDRLEIFGILESVERDEPPGHFFYGLKAESVENLTRHSEWQTCYSAIWGDDE